MTTAFIPPNPPTPEDVRAYLNEWSKREDYMVQDKALCLLCKELWPENTVIEHVLVKVAILNQFYSTNIFLPYVMAEHIVAKEIDQRLAQGDPQLVDEIATITFPGKTKSWYLYSFASKYCNHHNSEAFPIYDNYVEKVLVHYKDINRFEQFAKSDLKQFARFAEVVRAFHQFFSLTEFSLREVDMFLFLVGKRCFPIHYGKRQKQESGL